MENNTNSKPQIVETAVAMFKEKGFDKVSIVDICKACGITRTTFYYHFQSKEDILESYYENRLLSQKDMFAELIKRDNELDRYYALVDMLASVFLEEGPLFSRQILHSILERDQILTSYLLRDEWCVPILTNCQKNDLIRTDISPEEIDALCVSLVLGLCFQWSASDGSFDLQATIRTSLEQLLRPETTN